jgi:hypothetical protein
MTTTPLATIHETNRTLVVETTDPYYADHTWRQRAELLRITGCHRLQLKHEEVFMEWAPPPLPRRRLRVGSL